MNRNTIFSYIVWVLREDDSNASKNCLNKFKIFMLIMILCITTNIFLIKNRKEFSSYVIITTYTTKDCQSVRILPT